MNDGRPKLMEIRLKKTRNAGAGGKGKTSFFKWVGVSPANEAQQIGEAALNLVRHESKGGWQDVIVVPCVYFASLAEFNESFAKAEKDRQAQADATNAKEAFERVGRMSDAHRRALATSLGIDPDLFPKTEPKTREPKPFVDPAPTAPTGAMLSMNAPTATVAA